MLLPWLIFIPVIAAFLCWFSDRLGNKAPRIVAAAAMAMTLFISLILWLQGDYSLATADGLPQWQAEFTAAWIPSMGISFHLALDGLSLLMVVLTAFLGLLAVICSWNEKHRKLGLFHFNMMLTVAGVMGVFLAIDMFLFFFFWEMMLIPMFFMIALWGHQEMNGQLRSRAAKKFLIYTQTSGLVLLIAIVGLVAAHAASTGIWTFDYNALLGTKMPVEMQYLLMIGFFVAFAVKMPLVPVHGWLVEAHAAAPTAGSIDLSGLLLKTAAYGLLRFSLPLFPEASAEFAPVAMTLGVIGIFYGAWLAFAQTDVKRLIAYTSVSHMGFVMIAIYSGSTLAYQGAVIQMIAHGLSAAGMFIIAGILYERLKTRDMRKMGGLWGRIQFIPALSLFFAVATLGMPGTGNFVGEFMMLFGSFKAFPTYVIVATFGLVFASAYSLIMMQRIYYGVAKSESQLKALTVRELSMLFVLVILVVIVGVYPQPLLDTTAAAMGNIQQWVAVATQGVM